MSLLDPSSVAVIGASAQPGKVGHDILKNLLTQGYAGTVYPVNPKGGEILGATAYASVKDLPETPELAIIVIPALFVPAVLTECAEKGVQNVVVISAGFGEVHTEEGKKLEEQLTDIARKHGITLIGPNCLGIVRPGSNMNASFAKDIPPAGGIAVISQSGAMGVALMDGAASFGLGLSAFVSIGNKAATDESDMLEMMAEDPHTNVIGLYLESIKDGRAFLEKARKVTAKKPVVLLKAGVSEHGRKAASSHTGALAGSDSAIDALCVQAGIRRARTTEEFLDMLSALSLEPALLSNRVAVITNAGGPGILATDAAEKAGLRMPGLAAWTAEKLRGQLPAAASVANPIDVIGDAGTDRYEAAFNACQEDPHIDGIVVLLTPQVMTPCEDIARVIVDLHRTSSLMPVVCAFMGGESVRESKRILREGGIPTFATPERAVAAMGALRSEEVRDASLTAVSCQLSAPSDVKRSQNAQAILKGQSGLLDEKTTTELFALYDLPLPKQALATSGEEAVRVAQSIGYPLIAKISSPDILHKTDVGGVRANISTAEEAALAYRDIVQNIREHAPEATVGGVLFQQFLPVGDEFIVGSVRDPSFGPLVMAGLGGIYTELFRDTSFRVAPVDTEEAYRMLSELDAWKLLLGMRGKPQSDIDALATLISNVSLMVMECPAIKELDINPVIVRSDGLVIADAKVVME